MDFVTGSLLGGMLYDVVKCKQVTVAYLKEKGKADLQFWPADDHITEQITKLINHLGHIEGESKGGYRQRLEGNTELNQLLHQIKPIDTPQVLYSFLKDMQTKAVETVTTQIATLSQLEIHPEQLPELETALGRLQGIVERKRSSGLAGVEQTDVFANKIDQHFSSLEIQSYKRLHNLKITKLSRINLIAGSNNSGKTSLLEAIYLLTKHNDFAGILEVIRRRGKVAEDHLIPKWFIDQLNGPSEISGIFNNKSSTVSISSKPERSTDLDLAHYLKTVQIDASYDKTPMTSSTRLFKGRERHTQADGIKILCHTVFSSPFFLNEPQFYAQFYRQSVQSKALEPILEFLRHEVIDTLKDIRLVDDLQRFLVDDDKFDEAVDLTSYGKGVQRMFFISLLFASARNGVLLIDELENAIHTKLITTFAPFIYKLAVMFNVQVFLTSHSKECIDAFVNHVPVPDDFAYHALVNNAQGDVEVREYNGVRYKKLLAAGDVDLRKAR